VDKELFFFEKTYLSIVEFARPVWYFIEVVELGLKVVAGARESQVAEVNLGKIATLLGRCGNGDEIQRL
jgi:hypothetical protein